MEKIFVFLVAGLLICSCSKNDNDQVNVTIRGRISASGAKPVSGTKGSSPLSIADAKKVMVFNGSQYNIFDIVDSTFSVSAEAGTANAMVFLNEENKFIGVLCTEGLNVLPLVGLKDGDRTIIDLQSLTMPGDSIVPMHNPFGDEIGISDQEIESMKAVGSYYESLAKNIDADNDGQLDILSNRQITIIFHFNLFVGNVGVDNIPPTSVKQQNFYLNYGVEFQGGNGLGPTGNSATLTGPEGNPSDDIFLWGFMNSPNTNSSFLLSFNRQGPVIPGSPMGNNFLPFEKGLYTLTPYQGTSLKLYFSNVDARENLIIISPTLKTDSNGKITAIEFKYTMPDGSPFNPENMISDFMIQCINTNNQQYIIARPVLENQGFYRYVLATPVDLSSFRGIDLFYYDLLGNYYNNNWSK